jgi:MFS superfamily sulfate permease-like transporter
MTGENCIRVNPSSSYVGITVGAVVVPQGMAYAILADLPAQFGLYSSFMGVLIYWFFATSKDITIGVRSLEPV